MNAEDVVRLVVENDFDLFVVDVEEGVQVQQGIYHEARARVAKRA